MSITNEQVKSVLTALGLDGLLDFPIAWDRKGVGYFEYVELSDAFINVNEATVQSLTDYINNANV